MNIILGIVIGLLVLMFLIVTHEFGHFLMARRNGVRVKEFAVCFPPRLFAWVRNPKTKKWQKLPKKDWDKEQKSLILSVNAIPIGGFCAMDGESDADERPGTFGSVSYWKKTKILFGGVLMNWLTAFVILTILAWTGLPTMLERQFSIASDEHILSTDPVAVLEVKESSPAEAAGFKVNDEVLSVNGTPIYSSSDVIAYNNTHPGETVSYVVSREGTEESLEVTLNDETAEYLLGIVMNSGSTSRRYSWSAPLVGAGLTVQLTTETYRGLGTMLWNLITGAARQVNLDSSVREEGRAQMSEATEGVSGIVGILGGYFPGIVSAGPTYVALLAAIIAVSLACMNVLPIPALDGGRWFMITIARLRHKKLAQETEQKIVARAFVFLLILMAIITVMDIIRLF